MMHTDIARETMIEQQVRAWAVFDPDVLEVLREVQRENFVPRDFRSMAFADSEIPIGFGEYMMTPMVEGRVLQALELTISDTVLEVGTGTGFLTACLATLARHVTSLEIHDRLLKRASENIADARIDNVDLLPMDATAELPEGRFDAIVITGSMHRFDTRFFDALAPDGRLFVVIGDAPIMEARLLRRTGDSAWETQSLFETSLKPLVNANRAPQFTF